MIRSIYVFQYSCIWLRLIRKVYFSINRCLKFASLGIAKELKRVSTPQGHGLFLHWKNALHYGSLILITYMYPIVSKVKAKVTAEKLIFQFTFCVKLVMYRNSLCTLFLQKRTESLGAWKSMKLREICTSELVELFLKEDFILKGSSICCIKYWCGCISLLKVQAFLWAYKLLYSRTFIGYCRTRFNAHNRVSFCHGNNK